MRVRGCAAARQDGLPLGADLPYVAHAWTTRISGRGEHAVEEVAQCLIITRWWPGQPVHKNYALRVIKGKVSLH